MKSESPKQVAVIGSGLIGRSWAVSFARAGCHVTVHCKLPSQVGELQSWVANTCEDLIAHGLQKERADEFLSRIQCVTEIEEAVAGAVFVQENLPEDLELKREIFQILERFSPSDATLASSTSAIPASEFTRNLATRGRCLVAHPVNPPHLVPLVEIVPAPWTEPIHTRRAYELMRQIGQVPITVTQEIPGFVLNRLQAALLEEAWRLVEDGVASADDVDKAVRDGLGLRWAFIGPFENGDLNAPNGIADYAHRYGPMLRGLCESMGPPRVWSEELISKVERERRALLPISAQPERMRWRDQKLMALRALKGDYGSGRESDAPGDQSEANKSWK